jgi:hypothetical protein
MASVDVEVTPLADGDFSLTNEQELIVFQSPPIISFSNETTIIVVPSEGFNAEVTFSIADVLDEFGSPTTIGPFNLNWESAIFPTFDPPSLDSMAYDSGTQFSVGVHGAAFDPDEDQRLIVVVEASGGGITSTVDVPLVIKAGGGGPGET